MNFQLSLEKKINKFGEKAKILAKDENAHEIRKKHTVYVRACFIMTLLPPICIFETFLEHFHHSIEFFFTTTTMCRIDAL